MITKDHFITALTVIAILAIARQIPGLDTVVASALGLDS